MCIRDREIPYDIKKVVKAVERRAAGGHGFSIVCVAEGAFDVAAVSYTPLDVYKRQSKGCPLRGP